MQFSAYFRLMRLHQPVGIWLLLWPCWWSLALASLNMPPLKLLALFAAGAAVMRAAGCIINDLWDRKIDQQVERTRSRPLASGEILPHQAIFLLVALLSIALCIALALGGKIVVWSAASLPLVALYPLMKRITWWPQLFLGLTFNWGALLGWVAVRGEVEMAAVYLYIAGVFWTLGYDTIYAHQDTQDDARIGVKSTALRLGAHSKHWIAGFYAVMLCFLMLACATAWNGEGWFLLPLVAIPHYAWQWRNLQPEDRNSCFRVFSSNVQLGTLIFLFFLFMAFWRL